MYFIVIVNVGVDQNLNGFVGAVGKKKLVRRRLKNAASAGFDLGVFGINREAVRDEARAGTRLHGRAADCVLVEIESQFSRAARRSAANRAPCSAPLRAVQAPGGSSSVPISSRTSTERACASSPSARASVVMAGASFARRGRQLLDRDNFHVIGGGQAAAQPRGAAGRKHVIGRLHSRRRLPD